ncbi:2Fe-2S iron-sulfur cluster-binding protein [Streptomyces sp. NPDC090108]|uniref:2Fe-2S iron-sulfur cluster-binding protein n=1 Tax=Streptomyces sp. NPDC090108 TaxID=3365947 RepID=UPI003830E6ED
MTDDPYGEGAPPSGGSRWDPLPQGDYDDGATAFVKLPEGGIEALLAGDSPLAAPGHGYVPPPITAHPGAGEPAHADAWGAAADGQEWPDPNAVPREQAQGDRFTYPSGATQHWTYEEPAAPQPAPGHDVTGHWSVPVAGGDLPDESGEFTTSALVEQWGGVPPATLPGGAPAPWATEGAGQPWGQPEAAPQHTVQPGHGQDGPHDGHPGGFEHDGHDGHPGGFEHDGHAQHFEPAAHDGHGAHGEAHQDGTAAAPGAHGAEGFAPGGFAPQGAYAQGPAGQAPPPQPALGYPDYADEYAGDAAGPDEGAEDIASHGDAPAQGPGGPAGGPAAQGAATEAGPAPQAPEEPATAGAPAAAGPDGGPHPFGAPGLPAESGPHGPGEPGEEAAPAAPFGTAQAPAGGPDAGETPGAPDAAEASDADADAPGAGDPEAAGAEGAAEDAAQELPAEDTAPVPPHDDHPLASYVLRVNGADRPVTDAWIGESLLYVLRERLGLAGAKDGCSQGECGACNVQVDGRLVASCLVPAVTSAGSEVRTVEGLATDGHPSDVQRALARCGAVQCGFCVPGMAMTLHDLLEGNPAPTEMETRQALCGNLCRCSGYRGVLDAVQEVVAEREAQHAADAEADGDEARIPHQAGPGAGGVNASAFDTPGVFDSPGTYGTPGPHDPHYGQDGGQA